jgi:hypothetical protein
MNKRRESAIALGRAIFKPYPHLANLPITISERMKRDGGACIYKKFYTADGHVYKPTELRLASWLVDHAPIEGLIELVRHEAAHAIAGYDAAHGPQWKRVAQLLGIANPKACYPGSWNPFLPTTATQHMLGTKAVWHTKCSCGHPKSFHDEHDECNWCPCPKYDGNKTRAYKGKFTDIDWNNLEEVTYVAIALGANVLQYPGAAGYSVHMPGAHTQRAIQKGMEIVLEFDETMDYL